MGNRPFSRKICNFFCKLTAFYPLRHGFAVPDSPFCRYATSSPGRGKSFLKGRAIGMTEKLPVELQLSFAFTTPPVKMRLERSAERDKREI